MYRGPVAMKAVPLWVDMNHKIVSFHETQEGKRMDFQDDKRFQAFLEGLVDSSYRFQ